MYFDLVRSNQASILSTKVLLDNDGYTVIIDLGFAKIIKDKTYTFCGTPLYLAPEIIMQMGHAKGADLWVSRFITFSLA